jgi:hypothetical protein
MRKVALALTTALVMLGTCVGLIVVVEVRENHQARQAMEAQEAYARQAMARQVPEPRESSIASGTVLAQGSASGTMYMTGSYVVSSGSVITVTNSEGYVVQQAGGAPLIVSSRPPPRLIISCDETECHAHSGLGMEDAKAMLERVTQRRVQIELVTDQRCQTQREVIPPQHQDLVAAND